MADYLNNFHLVSASQGTMGGDLEIFKVVEQMSDNLIAVPVNSTGKVKADEQAEIFDVPRIKTSKMFQNFDAAFKYYVAKQVKPAITKADTGRKAAVTRVKNWSPNKPGQVKIG